MEKPRTGTTAGPKEQFSVLDFIACAVFENFNNCKGM